MKNIEKLIYERGFDIYIQLFKRKNKNTIGYVYITDDKKIIVIESPNILHHDEYRFYLSLALCYYDNNMIKENIPFYLTDLKPDDKLEEQAINQLVSDKKFRKYYKKLKNNTLLMSSKLDIPVRVIEDKIKIIKKNN